MISSAQRLAGLPGPCQALEAAVAGSSAAAGPSSLSSSSPASWAHPAAARCLSSAAGAGAASSSGAGSGSDAAGGSANPTSWQSFFERPGRRRAPPDAWRQRLPGKGARLGRYGVLLAERDLARFERMRLVLGFYDLPANAHLPRPPAPARAAVNNLQTLFFTRDIDEYYKLALLSYRTKQANRELVAAPLAATAELLDRLEGEAAAFTPNLPGGDAAGSSSSSAGGGKE